MQPPKRQLHKQSPISATGSGRLARYGTSKFTVALRYGLFSVLLSMWMIFGLSFYSQRTPHLSSKPLSTKVDFDWKKVTPSRNLRWVPCYASRQCARLEVPLDYVDPTGGKATIALLRVKSKTPHDNNEYRGPILVNPGGPGGSGTQFVDRIGDAFQDVLGEEYDIIGFDPRGIGETTPPVSSFADDMERGYWDARDAPLINSSSDALPRAYSRAKLLGELTAARSRRAAEHVSTAVVARDMLTITKAHGRDKLQYWGFSYGTVLGATYAAMFPENIERLIIDGVVDFHDYYSGTRAAGLYDTDKALQYFYDKCFEAGSDCPLHANSSALVQRRVEAVLASIKARPLAVFDGIDYDIIDYTILKKQLFLALYKPFSKLPALAHALAALENGDGGPALALWRSVKQLPKCNSPSRDVVPRSEAGTAISCGEIQDAGRTIPDIIRHFEKLSKVSVFSDVWTDALRIGCTGWEIRAKEIYAGPFTTNTSFPLLIIGNTADPATPLRGAKKAAEGFSGSALLTVNTPGHGSLAATSTCASKHIRQYFREGKLPREGTVCEIEDKLFGDAQGGMRGLSPEDEALFEVSRSLSRGFQTARGWSWL